MRKYRFFIPVVLWIILITVLSLLPSQNLKKFSVDILSIDKIAHFFIYAILSFFIAWGIKKYRMYKNLSLKILVIVFLCSSIYGVGIEYIQNALSTGRHFEYYDIIANIIGSITGLLFFIRKKQ